MRLGNWLEMVWPMALCGMSPAIRLVTLAPEFIRDLVMQNILVFCVDQMRADFTGAAGRFPVSTPNLDRLAAEGVTFERSYCSNPSACRLAYRCLLASCRAITVVELMPNKRIPWCRCYRKCYKTLATSVMPVANCT